MKFISPELENQLREVQRIQQERRQNWDLGSRCGEQAPGVPDLERRHQRQLVEIKRKMEVGR